MRLRFPAAVSVLLIGSMLAMACGDDSSSTTTDGTADAGKKKDASKGDDDDDDDDDDDISGDDDDDDTKDGGATGDAGDAGRITDSGSDVTTPPVVDGKIKAGDTQVLGVTTGAQPHVVYYVFKGTNATDIEAAPVAGGAAISLATNITDQEGAIVSGGAVAIYKGFNTGSIYNSVTIWTKTAGAQVVTSKTRPIFAANADGSRVAFSVGATATSTGIAVTGSVTPSATPVVTDVNLAAANCQVRAGFAGETFAITHCTGTTTSVSNARFVTVSAGATTPVVRVDNAGTDGLVSLFYADTTGSKFVVVGRTNFEGRLLTLNGANTTIGTTEANLNQIAVLPNGSAAVYVTATGALKSATFAATPTVNTLVATGVDSLWAVAPDSSKIAFGSLYDADEDLSDVKVIAATGGAVTTAVSTATAYMQGFSPTGDAVLYLEGFGTNGSATLKSVTLGGTPKTIEPGVFGVNAPETGNKILAITSATSVGQSAYSVSYKTVDVTGATASVAAVTDSLLGSDGWSGKTFWYTNISAANPGVYSYALP